MHNVHLGNTALHKASKLGKFKAVLLLIRFGADVNIVNEDGRIASDYAPDAKTKQAFQIGEPGKFLVFPSSKKDNDDDDDDENEDDNNDAEDDSANDRKDNSGKKDDKDNDEDDKEESENDKKRKRIRIKCKIQGEK